MCVHCGVVPAALSKIPFKFVPFRFVQDILDIPKCPIFDRVIQGPLSWLARDDGYIAALSLHLI